MKKLTVRALTLALALAATGTAMAQDRYDGRYAERNDTRTRIVTSDQRDYRGDYRDARRSDYRDERRERYERAQRRQARHEYRRFHAGERMPLEYRNRQYVVQDYRAHHLNAPRRGHQWVQTGSDYAMVAIATGLIFQVLQNH